MPFIIWRPMICDEFTLPKRSISIAVFMEMTPRRRTISGLLEISCGRMRMRERKMSRLPYTCSAISGPSVSDGCRSKFDRAALEQRDRRSPAAPRYISRSPGSPGWRPRRQGPSWRCSPTPDCNGRNDGGMRPARISSTRNSATYLPIFSVSAGSENGSGLRRLSSVRRRRRSSPDRRHDRRADAIGATEDGNSQWRAGGSFGSKMSCMPSSARRVDRVRLDQHFFRPRAGRSARRRRPC